MTLRLPICCNKKRILLKHLFSYVSKYGSCYSILPFSLSLLWLLIKSLLKQVLLARGAMLSVVMEASIGCAETPAEFAHIKNTIYW